MRIASLLPSATEIVCALGIGDRLVGVSHECDYPPEVVGLPVLTAPKLDPRGTSGEIDLSVRRLVEEGLGVYRIDVAALERLRPDLIVTQDQCDVCAVPLSEVEAAARACLGEAAKIVSLRPSRLADVYADIRAVAAAAGVVSAGELAVVRMQERLAALTRRSPELSHRPRVACLEWLDPLMSAGNWVPELVEIAGGGYDLVAAGEHSPVLSSERLAGADPEVIVLMPCGFALPQTRRELPQLTAQQGWRDLVATRQRRVYAVDGNAYLNRPGPRLAESAELLAGLIHPDVFADLIPPGAYRGGAITAIVAAAAARVGTA